jgi:hypothetical protein
MQDSSRVEAGYKHPIKQEARNIRKKGQYGENCHSIICFLEIDMIA